MVLPPEVEESARAMAANGKTKALISPPPRLFQHQLFTFRSVHDSDHGSVVRISVGQSKHYIYVAQFSPYQECNARQGVYYLYPTLIRSAFHNCACYKWEVKVVGRSLVPWWAGLAGNNLRTGIPQDKISQISKTNIIHSTE